jgi:hypothetical protein
MKWAIRYKTRQGGSPVAVEFAATENAGQFGTAQLTMPLRAGLNTLVIDNPETAAPAIDKIVVSEEK